MVRRIAVSMPEVMYADMERARKATGQDRSSWVQQAIADRLERERKAADIAAYIRGYQLHPETEEEMLEADAWLRHGPVYDDDWPEAPR